MIDWITEGAEMDEGCMELIEEEVCTPSLCRTLTSTFIYLKMAEGS